MGYLNPDAGSPVSDLRPSGPWHGGLLLRPGGVYLNQPLTKGLTAVQHGPLLAFPDSISVGPRPHHDKKWSTTMHTTGQRVGYVRVSSADQNTARQLDGHHLDRVFTDELSGKSKDRAQLTALRQFVRAGDTVLVHSMDRLARNVDDLRQLVREFTDQGVEVTFVKEALTFKGDDSPMSALLLTVMGAFAEFERALIRERQAEGIAAAKKRGTYQGRKPALTRAQADALQQRVAAGESISALAREFGIARQTAHSYARQGHPKAAR